MGKNKTDLINLYLYYELCKRDFWQFCKFYDPKFFAEREFLHQVADAMQDITDDKIKSLSVSLPPRAGKSYITSIYCAWVLGNHPTESVMRNTCTATLYTKFSYDVRDIVKSEKFTTIFPDVCLSSDTILFTFHKYFNFPKANIEMSIEKDMDQYTILLTSEVYAKSVAINMSEVDVVLSDNYFDMLPDREYKISINKDENLTLDYIKRNMFR